MHDEGPTQPEQQQVHKPLSHRERTTENIDDLLAARTIKENLEQSAKRLPQEDKDKTAGGSSQADKQE